MATHCVSLVLTLLIQSAMGVNHFVLYPTTRDEIPNFMFAVMVLFCVVHGAIILTIKYLGLCSQRRAWPKDSKDLEAIADSASVSVSASAVALAPSRPTNIIAATKELAERIADPEMRQRIIAAQKAMRTSLQRQLSIVERPVHDDSPQRRRLLAVLREMVADFDAEAAQLAEIHAAAQEHDYAAHSGQTVPRERRMRITSQDAHHLGAHCDGCRAAMVAGARTPAEIRLWAELNGQVPGTSVVFARGHY